MESSFEVDHPRVPPPPPPKISIEIIFATPEEANMFRTMMEHHEQHAMTYGGDMDSKQMARNLSDTVHRALDSIGFFAPGSWRTKR